MRTGSKSALGCLIIFALLIGSCFWVTRTRYDKFDFIAEPTEANSLTIHTSIRGAWQEVDSVTTNRQSPYYLLLIFEQQKMNFSEIEVIQVELLAGDQTIYKSTESKSAVFKSYDFQVSENTHSSARLTFNDLQLPHVSLKLRINYCTGADGKPKEIELDVLPHFSRERSNRIWDAIMSV